MAEDTLKIKKDTLWKAATVVLVVALVVVLILTAGGKTDGNAIKPTEGQAAGGNVKVVIDDTDPVLGNKNADISIVEFSDFQCPYCGRAYEGAMTDFENSDYFTNGEVNLVYKHLPLTSIHSYAQKAAEAAVCAQEQGKFWEMHNMMFENQNALDIASLKSYAKDLGLDTDEFNSCLDNGDARSKVAKDSAQAQAAGARGTPYFVVVNTNTGETQVVSGAVPFSNFEAAINAVM